MLVHAINNAAYEFAADVRAGLTAKGQKELASKYLYDDVGSALFEVISHLPEYGLTRADERLLQSHADEIVQRLDAPVAVAELGSGSGKKTRYILEALSRWAGLFPNCIGRKRRDAKSLCEVRPPSSHTRRTQKRPLEAPDGQSIQHPLRSFAISPACHAASEAGEGGKFPQSCPSSPARL